MERKFCLLGSESEAACGLRAWPLGGWIHAVVDDNVVTVLHKTEQNVHPDLASVRAQRCRREENLL